MKQTKMGGITHVGYANGLGLRLIKEKTLSQILFPRHGL